MTYKLNFIGVGFNLTQACIFERIVVVNTPNHPALLPAIIALITTVLTTSFTHYLLQRPWCIQINADRSQQIVYGPTGCNTSDIAAYLPPGLALGFLTAQPRPASVMDHQD